MYGKMKEFLAKELADIKAAGLYKNERIITHTSACRHQGE